MPTNPLRSVNGSVVAETGPPRADGNQPAIASDYILFMAGVADALPEWGHQPRLRDAMLRRFWPTEPILASALFSTASRYAGFAWDLDGADKMVSMYTRILHSSQHGKGWQALIMPFTLDYLTTDNGGFMEVVRTDDAPTAPVVQLNHLDSNQCQRTGNSQYPVIYWDLEGIAHRMAWYQVLDMTEMASPVDKQFGRQYCAVTRMLKAAQLSRDVVQYKRERATGQDTKQIHVVSGVSTNKIDEAISAARVESQAQGMARYTRAVIVGTLSPEARAGVDTIDLAKLPDGYDEEKAQRDYITIVAMALGIDYQDLAPLPTGTMGSGAQSEVLALKARGKGPNYFMRGLEFLFNYHGILPANLAFGFGEQDVAQDLDNAKLRLMRAEERAMRIKSGEIDEDAARALAVAAGDLSQEQADGLKGHVAPVPPAAGQGTRDGGRLKVDTQQGGNPAASIQTA